MKCTDPDCQYRQAWESWESLLGTDRRFIREPRGHVWWFDLASVIEQSPPECGLLDSLARQLHRLFRWAGNPFASTGVAGDFRLDVGAAGRLALGPAGSELWHWIGWELVQAVTRILGGLKVFPRPCPWCGRSRGNKRRDARFCSDNCRARYNEYKKRGNSGSGPEAAPGKILG